MEEIYAEMIRRDTQWAFTANMFAFLLNSRSKKTIPRQKIYKTISERANEESKEEAEKKSEEHAKKLFPEHFDDEED